MATFIVALKSRWAIFNDFTSYHQNFQLPKKAKFLKNLVRVNEQKSKCTPDSTTNFETAI